MDPSAPSTLFRSSPRRPSCTTLALSSLLTDNVVAMVAMGIPFSRQLLFGTEQQRVRFSLPAFDPLGPMRRLLFRASSPRFLILLPRRLHEPSGTFARR